ncbi:CKLF-like MARVEL transmembrane domain-containing protein 4 [Coccinella septempunctata]|uniref:CKLF-like MARVEL transmembrane domain-containing protein 4 n=1 Tax=Coccinella septempunctata TaxID=41139 RepID=UPI001D097F97|nr:CKLF-like MARVEL transmembrane domain-containing protein 4 [Coccinella septempunctata]
MMTETVVNVEQVPANNNANKNTTQGGPQPSRFGWIQMNLEYFKTTPGMLKIAEFIIGILCMSFATPPQTGTGFFLLVVTISFVLTLIWIFVYFLGVREATNFPINWILTEFLNTGVVTFLYFLGFIVQLITWSSRYHYKGVNITAGIFGMINTGVYAFASYLLYLEWKNRN